MGPLGLDRTLPLPALVGFSLQDGESWRKVREVLTGLGQNLDKLLFRAFYAYYEGRFLGNSRGLPLVASVYGISACVIREIGFWIQNAPKAAISYSRTFDGFISGFWSLRGCDQSPSPLPQVALGTRIFPWASSTTGEPRGI